MGGLSVAPFGFAISPASGGNPSYQHLIVALAEMVAIIAFPC